MEERVAGERVDCLSAMPNSHFTIILRTRASAIRSMCSRSTDVVPLFICEA